MDTKARQRAESIMASVVVNAPIEYRQWEQMRDRIERDIADAHAAGFAEAIKMAANVVDERARAWTGAPVGSPNHLYRLEAIAIRDEIRALAPAKTETPK